jgi:hypothetical protein
VPGQGGSGVFSEGLGNLARLAGIRRGIRELDYFKLAAWIAIVLGGWGVFWLIGQALFAIL